MTKEIISNFSVVIFSSICRINKMQFRKPRHAYTVEIL